MIKCYNIFTIFNKTNIRNIIFVFIWQIAFNVPVVCDVPARLISKPLGLRRAGMWWSEAWEPLGDLGACRT